MGKTLMFLLVLFLLGVSVLLTVLFAIKMIAALMAVVLWLVCCVTIVFLLYRTLKALFTTNRRE